MSAVVAVATRRRVAGTGADGDAETLMGLVDPAFLVEAGWDASSMVLCPPAEHPLLGRPVCRAAGCVNNARRPSGVCSGCAQRLAERGLGEEALTAPPALRRRKPGACAVAGCARMWASAKATLCLAHLHQQRHTLKLSLAQFLTDPRARGLPACEACLVPACTLQRRAPTASYCNAHTQRWWKTRQDDPDRDEAQWRIGASASTRPGEVSLRGLHPRVVAQLLLGLQERTRTGRKHFDEHLRYAVNEIRRQQVTTIADVDAGGMRNKVLRSLIASILAHLRRFFVDPETEKSKDVWDLAAFGATGGARFTEISQGWLREAAKRWAVDDLPRRRGSKIGADLRERLRCLARLSQSLRLRSDRGDVPGALGRADIENFLNRLAFLQSDGQVSAHYRRRVCLEVRTVLGRVRSMGLTRAGQPAAGLAEDFVLTLTDVPRAIERELCRDLPPDVMTQLSGRLPALGTSPRSRSGSASRCSSTLGGVLGRSASWAGTASTATVTASLCWSMTTTKPTGSAGACRSPRPPPR